MQGVTKYKMHSPPLSDIAKLLSRELKMHFHVAKADVVECPNLTEEPFNLAAPGLCGNTGLIDIGGVPYLVPVAQDKKYNFKEIAQQIEMPDAFFIGAGAGPRHYIGKNCELMANLKLGSDENNLTHIAKLNEDGTYELRKISECTDFCLLGNFFVSKGEPGEVIEITAKTRMTANNFVSIIRNILCEHFKTRPVGMGGVFLIKKGKAKLHIMPDYSKTPLKTDYDVENWLQFFTMNAPLVCLSTFVSSDPGLDLRVEHTHCFSSHGDGGHYHTDTTAEEVEYVAYFNIADYTYRIDPPAVTHLIGRD